MNAHHRISEERKLENMGTFNATKYGIMPCSITIKVREPGSAFTHAAALLLTAAKIIDGFAGWYSVNIYSLITATMGRLTGRVPFSVAEAAVCILPFVIIADIVICRKKLRRALLHILLIVSVLVFMYAANCGVNYSRDSFVDRQALAEAEFTEDQLADLCEHIITQIEAAGPETDSFGNSLEMNSFALDRSASAEEDIPSTVRLA